MRNKYRHIILLVIVAASGSITTAYHKEILDFLTSKDRFDGLATFLSVLVAIFIFWMQQQGTKTDAAKLIFTEISAAIPVAKEIATTGRYDQKTVCMVTDNWPNLAHFFVNDLSQAEMDQINKIYSRGRYINKCIERIDQFKQDEHRKMYFDALNKADLSAGVTAESVLNGSDVQAHGQKINLVGDAMINFAKAAAVEIADADNWTSFNRLREIAKLKK